jgi:hypothetical protein
VNFPKSLLGNAGVYGPGTGILWSERRYEWLEGQASTDIRPWQSEYGHKGLCFTIYGLREGWMLLLCLLMHCSLPRSFFEN